MLFARFVAEDNFSDSDRMLLRVRILDSERRAEKIMKYYQGLSEIKNATGPE